MVAAARRYGTVFQTGSQQRSDTYYFRQAHDLVRSGAIGRVERVVLHIRSAPTGNWQQPRTPPQGLDWDFWLGPAPYADYTPDRCHYFFRWYSDYSGGIITDHGAHHCDIAQWIIGADGSGPTRVAGSGTFRPDLPHDVAITFQVDFTYGQHQDVQLQLTTEKSPRSNTVEIYGSKGWLSVSRRRLQAEHPEILSADAAAVDYQNRLTESYAAHHANWLDCIRSRERPALRRGDRPSRRHAVSFSQHCDSARPALAVESAARGIRRRRAGKPVPVAADARHVAFVTSGRICNGCADLFSSVR